MAQASFSDMLQANMPPPKASSSTAKKDFSSDVAAENKAFQEGEGDVLSRIRQSEQQLSSLPVVEPPKLEPMPKQEQFQTPASQRYASAGMLIATLGSLFARHSLTTAANSMAGVLNAYNTGDATRFKEAYDQWKVANENAMKMANWDLKNINSVADRIAKGEKGAEEEGMVLAKAMQNGTLATAIKMGQLEHYRSSTALNHKNLEKATFETNAMFDDYNDKLSTYMQKNHLMDVSEIPPGIQSSLARQSMADISAAKKSASDQVSDEEYKKEFDAWKAKPRAKMIADAIANGLPPSYYIRTRGKQGYKELQFAQDYAQELHPGLDLAAAAEDFKAANAALQGFARGKQGDTVRSFNVAYQHIGVLDEMAKALHNGDVRMINSAKLAYESATGDPAPTNFDAVKTILADEVNKAAVGGVGALEDRTRLAASINRANSLPQLEGAMDTFKKLIIGQMEGMKQQYESSTKRSDFDRLLLPEVKRDLNKSSTKPSDKDIEYLRAHPDSRKSFDKHFGEGTAEQYLGK